jgi:hypothetical protein
MAAKSTENVEKTETAEDVKIPHQHDAPRLEVIEGEKVSFAEKAKSVLRNKKFLAGVSSVALIAAGVFVVNKKRNEDVSEDEVTSD